MKTKIEVCKTNIINQEKVEKARKTLPKEREIRDLAETFKVLGDPTRIQILLALATDELCVCDLAALIGVTVSAISHQLRMLKNLKLVTYRKDGKIVFYSLDDAHVENLLNEALTHLRE